MAPIRTMHCLLASLAFLFTAPALGQDRPPPWADAFKSPTSFLACKGNPYALCYYSGPAMPTPRYGNVASPALPCTVKGDDAKAASCTCYAITEKQTGPLDYNFVLIGSILNPEIRKQTIEQCGKFGQKCLNMVNLNKCQVDSSQPDCQAAEVCSRLGSIKDKTRPDLFPNLKNVELISTFSFTYSFNHNFGSTNCAATSGRYAGCMTAPCTTTEEGLTTCSCPIYDGPFQIGQDLTQYPNLGCDISPNVWSAANNLNQDSTQ